ncbi:MAG: hypothetical protein LLG16_06415 [Euryarchaeota archaeon]|nr:hypothetical protein [Euryarchaeota archaeon]
MNRYKAVQWLDRMKVGVCGIACEVCPRMTGGTCPNGPRGRVQRSNRLCKICSCALGTGVRTRYEYKLLPYEKTKEGLVSFGHRQYISGKVQ